MNIRPAVAEDVPSVLPMVGRICALHESWDHGKYGFKPEPARRYEKWLEARSADERSVFLVAEETEAQVGGRLVGFLVATTEPEIGIYRLTEYGFIHDLWVEPDYRNSGLGRELLLLAVERFRQIGVEQVRADTAAKNEPARRLLEACGFRVSAVEMLIELKG